MCNSTRTAFNNGHWMRLYSKLLLLLLPPSPTRGCLTLGWRWVSKKFRLHWLLLMALLWHWASEGRAGEQPKLATRKLRTESDITRWKWNHHLCGVVRTTPQSSSGLCSCGLCLLIHVLFNAKLIRYECFICSEWRGCGRRGGWLKLKLVYYVKLITINSDHQRTFMVNQSHPH